MKLVQHRGASPAWDGATRIAAHYRFLLSHAFDNNPDAPYIIVVRSNLL